MDKRVLTYVAAGVLAVVGAGLLFLSLRGDDDNDDVVAPDTPVAEPAAEPAVDIVANPDADTDDATTGDEDGAATLTAAVEPAVDVPEDLVQISFALDTQRAFSGQLRPGDLVGVYASYDQDGVALTDLVLQKILVSAVREEAPLPIDEGAVDRLPSAPAGRFFVTLALSADDAESLTHVLEFGRVWLALQPDTAGEDAPGVEMTETVLTEVPSLEGGTVPETDADLAADTAGA